MTAKKTINFDFDTMAELPKVHMIARSNNMAEVLNGLVRHSKEHYDSALSAVKLVNLLGVDNLTEDQEDAFMSGYKIASDLALHTTIQAVADLFKKVVVDGMEVEEALDSFEG